LAEVWRSSIPGFRPNLKFCTKDVFGKGVYFKNRESFYKSLLSAGSKLDQKKILHI